MKAAASLFAAVLFTSGAAFAQQQPATGQMVCRDLASSGYFVNPDETVANGAACHMISQSSPPSGGQGQNFASGHAPANGAAFELQPAPRNSAPNSSPTLFIEPMQGFEKFLSVALQRKHVPVGPEIFEARASYILQVKWAGENAEVLSVSSKGSHHSQDVPTLQLVDGRSGAVLMTYTLNRENTARGEKGTAETIAMMVKEQIEKR
ncbi:MAG: hypothetical protein WCA38_06220 [Candidatus Acidiferrales bacterium]